MNRKIILLPLSALMMLGLASCGPAASTDTPSTPDPVSSPDSSVLPDSPESSEEEKFDGGVSDIEPGVDCAIIGRVAQVGSKGWTIADGKAAAYVYGTLPSDFKIGDIVNVTGKVQGYYGLYEITGATVTKNETVSSIELDEPVEITADIVKEALTSLAGKASGDATWKPENSKRYKISGLTAEDVSGYAGWTLTGLEPKLVSYYYVPGNNETEANRSTKLYAGCNYDVSFYINGTNAAGNVNMCIFDVTSHYDAVESVTVDLAEGESSIDLTVGDEKSLSATVLPANSDHTVVWSVEENTVVSLTGNKVTALSAGTAVVTATSAVDSSKFDTVTINVSEQSIPTEDFSVNMLDYVTEHENDEGFYIGNTTANKTLELSSAFTLKVSDGNNSGKIYVSTNQTTGDREYAEMRIYKSESATVTIEPADGYSLVRVSALVATSNWGGDSTSEKRTATQFTIGDDGKAVLSSVELNSNFNFSDLTITYSVAD